MATVVNNPMMKGLRGSFGNMLVFRQVHGQTRVSPKPRTPDKQKETPAQRKEFDFDLEQYVICQQLQNLGIYASHTSTYNGDFQYTLLLRDNEYVLKSSSLVDRFINYYESIKTNQSIVSRMETAIYLKYPNLRINPIDSINWIYDTSDFKKYKSEILLHKRSILEKEIQR